jgi:hypothetical protein
MMVSINRFEKARDLVQGEIAQVVERLCVERSQRCRLLVRCLADGVELPNAAIESGTQGMQAEGEARIILRPGFKETTVKVAYKVIVRRLAEETGFSGFSSEGRIDLADERNPIKVPTISYSYNKWRFLSPFDFEARGPIERV